MSNHERLVRSPAVAGRFYPADPARLATTVAAGYVYSGDVAGTVFANIEVPRRAIVLCPNHTGLGSRISLIDEGVYGMPGGDVRIDSELAAAVLEEVVGAESERSAHLREHAIEVELPFLRQRNPQVEIVPIVLSGLSQSEAIDLGKALSRAAARVGGDVLVVASSDMSHYLPDEEARRVDHIALEPLLDFDPGGLYRTVTEHDISMCGFIPATALLSYALEVNAQKPELVGYATSGDAFGDRERVVGYAGVIVKSATG
jgi:MEMO1 family protein